MSVHGIFVLGHRADLQSMNLILNNLEYERLSDCETPNSLIECFQVIIGKCSFVYPTQNEMRGIVANRKDGSDVVSYESAAPEQTKNLKSSSAARLQVLVQFSWS